MLDSILPSSDRQIELVSKLSMAAVISIYAGISLIVFRKYSSFSPLLGTPFVSKRPSTQIGTENVILEDAATSIKIKSSQTLVARQNSLYKLRLYR